jgi:hypothetical protein
MSRAKRFDCQGKILGYPCKSCGEKVLETFFYYEIDGKIGCYEYCHSCRTSVIPKFNEKGARIN